MATTPKRRLGRDGPEELEDGKDNVVDVAEARGLALLGVMEATSPVDGDVGLARDEPPRRSCTVPRHASASKLHEEPETDAARARTKRATGRDGAELVQAIERGAVLANQDCERHAAVSADKLAGAAGYKGEKETHSVSRGPSSPRPFLG